MKIRIILSWILIITVSVMAHSHDFYYDHVEYRVLDEEAATCMLLNSYYFKDPVLYIQGPVYDGEKEYTVVSIDDRAFTTGYSWIHQVYIGESVDSIGNEAFANCSNLEEVTIASAVKIGAGLFSGCAKLRKASLPAGLKKIPQRMFYGCENLKEIELSDSITEVGPEAFYKTGVETFRFLAKETVIDESAFMWSSLREIEFGGERVSIGYRAFYENFNLTHVNLGNAEITIGSEAFQECKNLLSLNLSKAVTVGTRAFWGCENLVEVSLPEKVAKIPDNSFSGCSSLSSIVVPDNVKVIGRNAFSGCGLEEIQFGKGLNSIGWNAFGHCTSLKKIKLGNSLKTIDSYAFCGCAGLQDVHFGDSIQSISMSAFSDCDVRMVRIQNIKTWLNIDFEDEYSNPLHMNAALVIDGKRTTEISIPESVKKIKKFAFINSEIASVINNSSVEEIDESAFGRCSNLKSVTLGTSLKKIGKGAFGYSAVEGFNFGPSLEYIDEEAFRQCRNLSRLSFPASLKEIGKYAFYLSGTNSIEFQEGLTKIGEYAFNACKLTELKLPNSLEEMDMGVFSSCINLVEVEWPASMEEVTHSAFSGCESLSRISLPENLKSIGDVAFADCSSLELISLPAGVESIGIAAFWKSNLKEIRIPESTVRMENAAFRECSNLKNAYVGGQIVGRNAFYDCQNLSTVTLGRDVKNIDEGAFYGCINLKEVYCEALTPPEVHRYAGFYSPATTTLHVPKGTKELYENDYNWWDFNPIIDDLEPAGIDDVIADDEVTAPKPVYNMQGICVNRAATSADIESLPSGVYIIGGRKVVKR